MMCLTKSNLMLYENIIEQNGEIILDEKNEFTGSTNICVNSSERACTN